jgi:hypothetical protein
MSEISDRPDGLFKYQRINLNAIRGLASQTFWCASPETFNDPYDCAYRIALGMLNDAQKTALNSRVFMKRIGNDAAMSTQFQNNQVALIEPADFISMAWGVCSFSAALTDHPDDMLMWGHYANGHRGMCLEFNALEEPFSKTLKVTYPPLIPSVDLEKLFVYEEGEERRKAFLEKYEKWVYEKEWRYVQSKVGAVPYHPAQLINIYFGAKTEQEDIDLVRSIVGECGVGYYRMIMAVQQYELLAEKL